MTRCFFTGSFLLLCYICTAQSYRPPLNAVQQEYLQSKSDTGRVRILLKWGDFYLNKRGSEKNDLDSAMLLLTQARSLIGQLGITDEVDHADRNIGQTMIEGKDYARLYRHFAHVSDPVRIYLVKSLSNFELTPPDRTAGSFDTLVAFLRKALPFFNSDQSLKGRLILLQRIAVLNYCLDGILHETPPSPSWVVQTAAANKDWLDPVSDWIAAHLRKDKELIAALDQCRQGLRTIYPQYSTSDQKDLITEVCMTFISVTAAEATNNFYSNNKTLTEKEYRLAVDFNRVEPKFNVVLYNNFASFYIVNGDLDKALSLTLEAVRNTDTAKGGDRFNELPYWITGQVYDALRQYTLAMEYFQKTLSLLRHTGRSPNENLLDDMVLCFQHLKQPAAALAFLKENIDSSRLDDKEYRRVVANAMGSCYFDLRQFKEAESYWLESHELNRQLHPRDQQLSDMKLGMLYLQLKQYDKVKKYVASVIQDSTKAYVSLANLSNAHFLLFKADSATGDYISAIRHLQANKSINDSIFDINKNKQAEELKVRYDTDKKDRDLLLQQASLREDRLLRNGLIAGAITLICLLSLLYARFRGKQKSNRLLQARQHEIDVRNQQLQDLAHHQQRLLSEKEWLMREIHHRVKNNLQIIISLLNMQGTYLKDELAIDAFGEIGSRIRAISLIHQKLYREDRDMAVIDMHEYINDLVGFLQDSMAIPKTIHFHLGIEAVRLGVVQCVPVGLILNEAITNAVKYAFPPARITHAPQRISISLNNTADGNIELIIADNGVGLPENFSHRHASMGFELIEMLSEQLEGTLTMENEDGLAIRLSFTNTIYQYEEFTPDHYLSAPVGHHRL